MCVSRYRLGSLFIIGLIMFALQMSSVQADPSDPFTGSAVSFDADPPQVESYNTGDWGVSDQRGSATYTYAINVPPGRNGMAPSLALRYSSQSPLRGGIAVGWTLDIPRIDLDTSLGKQDAPAYKASFRANSGRLVETADALPYPGKAYRLDFDDSFTRFFYTSPGQPNAEPRGWVALTSDGVKHFFDERGNATDFNTQWRITRQVDSFGNTIHYSWSNVVGPNDPQVIDRSLQRIEYTTNEAAGLQAHARVEFEYAPLEVCSHSNVPLGAAASNAAPGTVEGAERLTAIKTYVRDEPGGNWRLSKTVSLVYQLRTSRLHNDVLFPDPPPPDIYCTQSRLRYLTQINVTAYDRDGTATDLPPITFSYNDRIDTTRLVLPGQPNPLAEQTIASPGYGHSGNARGTQHTLLDLDSDGVRDRASVIEQDGMCTLLWQRGLLGGQFESTDHTSLLPTATWYNGSTPDPQFEHCGLNGQILYKQVGDIVHKGIVSYHFLDYTGDGRLDLLTSVWANGAHNEFVPVNLWPPQEQRQAVAAQLARVPNPPPGDPDSTAMHPEKQANDFTWRVFVNAGDPEAIVPGSLTGLVFSAIPRTVSSPSPLLPTTSEVLIDTSVAPNYSIPPLIDMDGDGFLDVVDVTRDPSDFNDPHPVLGQGDWTVYLGNGGPTFQDRTTALTWHVPAFQLPYGQNGSNSDLEDNGCGLDFIRRKHTIASMVDFNGNGLPDLLVQGRDLRLKAYLNTGSGFKDQAIDLGVSQSIDVLQTDCLSPGPTSLQDGNRGFRRRLLDLDSDGLPDIIRFSGSIDDGKTDIFSVGTGGKWRYSSGGVAGWTHMRTVPHSLTELAFGDFDGDGQTDIFNIDQGNQWRYSSGGVSDWTNLTNILGYPLSSLRFGDFDGDGKTDVFWIQLFSGGQWYYSSGGATNRIALKKHAVALGNLAFGDFNGDGKTDVFNISGNQWRYASGGTGDWINLVTSSESIADLRFGDFDEDGKTDVFSIGSGGRWRYSSGGATSWINLVTSSEGIADLRFGDFDGDGKTDVFSIGSGGQWRYSSGGLTSWINLATSSENLDDLRFGNFDDDITAKHTVYARFNLGDRFGPQVELPSVWLNTKRILAANDGEWQLRSDFVDVTGDGLDDLVGWNSANTLSFINRPGLPYAPDLLSRIENGRGLKVTFSYAPTTDRDVVQWTPLLTDGPSLPSVSWVVEEIKLQGGYGTPEMVTRYNYKNPEYISPSDYTGIPERSRYAGFGEVTVTTLRDGTSPARQVKRIYDYTVAPDGRLTKEWLYEVTEGTLRLHQYKENTWQQKPLFAGQSIFTHLDTTLTRICLPGMTETACMTQTDNVERYQETWFDTAPSQSDPEAIITGPGIHPPELYVQESTRTGTGLTENGSDRRTRYQYHLRYGNNNLPADDYRILPRQSILEQAVLDGADLVYTAQSKTANTYDPATGLAVLTTISMDETTEAHTRRTFDPLTGNVLTEIKPQQNEDSGSGNMSTYSYDAHQIFIQMITDELEHQLETIRDIATGVIVARLGPNFTRSFSGQIVWERESWQIDGFGRVLGHAISLDDETEGYLLHPVDKITYFDMEQPNRIQVERLRNFGVDAWITSDRTADGLGRLLSETLYLANDQTAVTEREYDSLGNLAILTVPDPSTDGGQVRYEYHYDGLDRLIDFVQPDGNGLHITYGGLEKTLRQITTDGSGATTKQVYDLFGRLIELYEFYPDAPAAVTQYGYDPRDNLAEIIDAEGTKTELTHDWAGNRIAITRAGRTWRYFYNLNSNLIQEIAPIADGEDAALRTITYQYDDLDRVTGISYSDFEVESWPTTTPNPTPILTNTVYLPLVLATKSSNSVQQTPSSSAMIPTETTPVINTARYFYDSGSNGLGRLNRVELPFGEIAYTYDARGLPIAESRSFNLTGIVNVSASQEVQRRYNALGLPTLNTWDDGQQWQIDYDERGLVDTVAWYDPQAETWQYVADYDRSIAGQIRMRNTAYRQTRQISYDHLGRPVQDLVLRPGHPDGDQVANRTYTYNDSSDLLSIAGETAGISAAASYTYDAQHRLIGAIGPNGYQGSFTYSPTGNVLTADVRWNGSNENRNVRYAYGASDPQAVDRLINISGGETYGSFTYDLAGNMVQRNTPQGTMNLDWNGLDQIRLIQGQDGAEIYFYDHTGMRMLAMNETDGLRFWFAESETHYALTGEQTRRYLHLFGEGPTLARVENSTEIELQYPDALQNLMFSLDTNSDITASFLYGPFGEVVYASGDEEHRRQFNGKENDALTGLRYYGYRYYDPLLLRWNSADPLYRFVPDLGQRVPQRMNLYAFSLNNPVRYYDADGRDPQDNQGVFGACKSGSDVCESPPSQDSSDESDEEEEEEEKQPEFLHEKVSHQPKLQTKVSANIIKGEGGKKNKSSKVTIAKIVWSVIEPLSKRWEGDDASLSAELRGPNASVQASYDDDGLELSSGAEAAGIGGCVETCSHISSFYDYCQSVCVGASVGASVNLKLGNGQTKLGASAGVSASVGGRIKQRTDSAAGLPNWPSSNHTLNIAGAALDIFTAIRGNVPLFPK